MCFWRNSVGKVGLYCVLVPCPFKNGCFLLNLLRFWPFFPKNLVPFSRDFSGIIKGVLRFHQWCMKNIFLLQNCSGRVFELLRMIYSVFIASKSYIYIKHSTQHVIMVKFMFTINYYQFHYSLSQTYFLLWNNKFFC